MTEQDAPELGSVKIEGDMGVIRIPLDQVHSLRVAIQPCPCKAAKSHATSAIRDRLDRGLARLQGMMR